MRPAEEIKKAQEAAAEEELKLWRKYHRVFTSKDGEIVLEDLKRRALFVEQEAIEFDDVSRPFCPERYWAREGARNMIRHIVGVMRLQEKEGADGRPRSANDGD